MTIPQLSRVRSQASKAERRPLTELLSPDMRTAFVRQVEPLISIVTPQYDVWMVEGLASDALKRLGQARELVQWAKAEGKSDGVIAGFEEQVEKAQKSWLSWVRYKKTCDDALAAHRGRTPDIALALLDPLPAPPAPVPAPQPSRPGDPRPHFVLHRAEGKGLRYWGYPEGSGNDVKGEEAEPGVYALLANADALAAVLSFLPYQREPNALSTTCSRAHHGVMHALEFAAIAFRPFSMPPFDQLPRLSHLHVLRRSSPPTLPWFAQVLPPVAPRLRSLRLSVFRSVLIDAFLQLDWPMLEELRLDDVRAQLQLAAHPRMQGGPVVFPRLRVIWWSPEERPLVAFANMADRGCFPSLRVLNDPTWPYEEWMLYLYSSVLLTPRLPAILAHASYTEVLSAECRIPWHSEAFYAHALAHALPNYTRLRTLKLSLSTWNLEDVQPLLDLLRALSAGGGVAASLQELSLSMYSTVAWDWDGPPLPIAAFQKLRVLEFSCKLSKRALASVLGAAGHSLEEIKIGQGALDLLLLMGADDDDFTPAAPPFPWMTTLKRLHLRDAAVHAVALRKVDRALARLPSLESLDVGWSNAGDAFLVLIIRQRERGGLGRLRAVNFNSACTRGGALLLLAFIKAQREGAARGLRFEYGVSSDDKVNEVLWRVLGKAWMKPKKK